MLGVRSEQSEQHKHMRKWQLILVCICTLLSLASKPVHAERFQAESGQGKPGQGIPGQGKLVQAEPVPAEPVPAEPGQAGSHPVSVVSINLCADQLVLLLADVEQIVSLSKLAHDKAGSRFYKQAQAYPVNQAAVEQILPLQPDLVIAGQFSDSYTIKLLKELGLRVEILPIADTINTMINNIKQVAGWVGQSARGDHIINDIQRRLAALQAPGVSRPTAAIYDPNGYTVGAESLRGQALLLAGWDNVASTAGITHYGSLPLETMVSLTPDAIIESPYSADTFSRAQQLNKHPALRHSGLQPHIIRVPSRLTICAGPWTLDVIENLQAERLQFESRQAER